MQYIANRFCFERFCAQMEGLKDIDAYIVSMDPGPRVYYNSARMVCQWSISDFTNDNLFVVDYQSCQNQPLCNQ